MNKKTLMVMCMAAMPATSNARGDLYKTACDKFSEKAIIAKFEELERRGYIESGISSRSGWLTEKGKAFLRSIIPASAAAESPQS